MNKIVSLSTTIKRTTTVVVLILVAVLFMFCAINCCLDCIEVFGDTTPAKAYSAGLTPTEYIENIGFIPFFMSIPISAQKYLMWNGVIGIVSIGFALAALVIVALIIMKYILAISVNTKTKITVKKQ